MNVTFWFLAALFLKHLVVDFICQTPYQYLNKGRYGHPGGLLHAGLHMVVTFGILSTFAGLFTLQPICPLGLMTALKIVAAEGLIHYHCDWGKVQLCRKFDLTAQNSEYFWWLLGVDQYVHIMTYLLMTLVYPG